MVRIWGWYITLFSAKSFKIKLLYFKPNGQCSFQKHKKRSELWCFLSGSGIFTHGKNKDQISINSGDCVSVPINHWHQYKSNMRTLVLEIQTGVCEEEDITREILVH